MVQAVINLNKYDNIIPFSYSPNILEPYKNLRKDGEIKKTHSNKQKGVSSEVFPFEFEDIKKMVNYFCEHKDWYSYLLFILGCNTGRRVGDLLKLKWINIFNLETGTFYKDSMMRNIVEEKTDKFAIVFLNEYCKKAILTYCSELGIELNNIDSNKFIFEQNSGKYKGKVVSNTYYRLALKKAAKDVGIEYNVGTHSPRKTFGKISMLLHKNDYANAETVQTIFNHSSPKITNRYIGLTRDKIKQYYDDIGGFFDEYIDGNKIMQSYENNSFIISVDINHLRELIDEAYNRGMKNSKEQNIEFHINEIENIIKKILK